VQKTREIEGLCHQQEAESKTLAEQKAALHKLRHDFEPLWTEFRDAGIKLIAQAEEIARARGGGVGGAREWVGKDYLNGWLHFAAQEAEEVKTAGRAIGAGAPAEPMSAEVMPAEPVPAEPTPDPEPDFDHFILPGPPPTPPARVSALMGGPPAGAPPAAGAGGVPAALADLN
jgi:hypothetical protein